MESHVCLKVHGVATRFEPSPSRAANVNQPIISGPLPEVVASGVIQHDPVPCTLCDRTFTSILGMQQASGFPTSSRQCTDFSPQHVRDKHNNTPTQVPTVVAQPPVQQPQPQVQVQYEQGAVVCEQCLVTFPSSKVLEQV